MFIACLASPLGSFCQQQMNNTNQIISVNPLELCCHWVQNLQSAKYVHCLLIKLIFWFHVLSFFPQDLLYKAHKNLFVPMQCNTYLMLKYEEKKIKHIFPYYEKVVIYTCYTKFVWQSINTPQCYDNTKVDQILIILWQCSWTIEHTVLIVWMCTLLMNWKL